MSRIGKQPVSVPGGVKVKVADGKVLVEGPKGKLSMDYHRLMKIVVDEAAKRVVVSRPDDERLSRASWIDADVGGQHGARRNARL